MMKIIASIRLNNHAKGNFSKEIIYSIFPLVGCVCGFWTFSHILCCFFHLTFHGRRERDTQIESIGNFEDLQWGVSEEWIKLGKSKEYDIRINLEIPS